MTALHKYDRLEAVAFTRYGFNSPWQEVIVQMGDSTLTFLDAYERPISHISLAALQWTYTKDGYAVYDLTPDGSDQMSTNDTDMITALGTIGQTISKRQKKPSRKLRRILLLAAVFVLFSLGYAGVKKLPNYAANTLPKALVQSIGQNMLQNAADLYGPFCTSPEGEFGLQRLKFALADITIDKLYVLPIGQKHIVILPNGNIIIPKTLIETAASPDIIAGYIIAASSNQQASNSIYRVLESLSTTDILQLLAGKKLPQTAFKDVTQTILTAPPTIAESKAVVEAFKTAGISTTPFSNAATTISQEFRITLKTDDPYPNGSSKVIMPDGAFLGLQAICD